ncbi:MAG: type II toxin-antitoxin system VapC family toxin [Acidobacteria bacterium]|nr:type II toxin-antitoxin system VapC family toxin [Acidobacteriota bacterium]
MTCYLDTQVMVWLCERQLDRLSPRATAAVEESELRISPMVLLELQYLYEIKRIVQPPQALLSQLESQLGLKLCSHPFPAIVQTALFETWTGDPFDRVIVAQARSNGYAPLVTSDSKIRKNYPRTVW